MGRFHVQHRPAARDAPRERDRASSSTRAGAGVPRYARPERDGEPTRRETGGEPRRTGERTTARREREERREAGAGERARRGEPEERSEEPEEGGERGEEGTGPGGAASEAAGGEGVEGARRGDGRRGGGAGGASGGGERTERGGGGARRARAEGATGGEAREAGEEEPAGGEGPDLEFMAIPAIPMARLGGFYPPLVEAPPASILQSEASIRAETGLSPADHHARVRTVLEGVTRAASEAQLDMVRRVENAGWDARFSIERLADQVDTVAEHAVGTVAASIRSAQDDIWQSCSDQATRIWEHQFEANADLVANRDAAIVAVQEQLLAGSARIQEFNTELGDAFDQYLEEAGQLIQEVPTTGIARHLSATPAPAGGGGRSASGETASSGGEGASEAAGPRLISEAGDLMIASLENEEGKTHLQAYEDKSCARALPPLIRSRQEMMERGARTRAEQLNSPATRAQFMIVSLGLTAPVARAAEEDAPGHGTAEERETGGEEEQQLTARERAVKALEDKATSACKFLDQERERIGQSLRSMARRIQQSLRNQARMAEVGIASAAASMAEAYPDVVRRLAQVLPPGKFHDVRTVLPQLEGAQQSVTSLHDQQLQTVREQADETLEGAAEGFREQSDGLMKAAQENCRSMEDAAITSAFDFELAADQFTGTLQSGTDSAVARATEYAERVAVRLMGDTARIRTGLTPLQERAISFLNNAVDSEAASYAEVVRTTEPDLGATPDGPLQPTREAVRTDVESRAQRIHDALPSRDTLVAVGTFVVSPLAGAAYLYYTDADEDDVLSLLGEIPWPGSGAIEEVYNGASGSGGLGLGNLRAHIEERMGDPEKGYALGLLSSSVGERSAARLNITIDSTGWFTGPSRETRDAVMRGFSAEEQQFAADEGWMDITREHLRGELSGSDLQIAEAYLDRNAGRVLAIRMEERLRTARRDGDDAVVTAMDEMETMARTELGGTVSTAFIPQEEVDALLGSAYREHAEVTSGEEGLAGRISEEEARRRFAERATADREVHVGEGETMLVPMGERSRAAIEATVVHGARSDEAWRARAAYEVTRAEGEWLGPSSDTQVRLTNALEDPALARAEREYLEATPERRAELYAQLQETRRAHRERMAGLARELDPTLTDEQIEEAGGAEELVAGRVASTFGEEGTTGHEYGREMILGGRASLLTGIRLATEGAGTNEDLLRSTAAGRTRGETEEARAEYAADHEGESLDDMLGITGDSWFAETSGDLAMELRGMLRGEPTTDADFVERAALEHNQQAVEGTGFLSSLTMEGTPEAATLAARRDEMGQLILDAARDGGMDVSGFSPSEVFNADGTIRSDIRARAFDERGRFRGDRTRLRDHSAGVRRSAEHYRAEIDRQESMMTSAITALAIVVTLVLMVIPGVNVVAAGILTALIAGAATIAVKAGMRGGRYGWEEAATDVGMTAIEAATAGFGGAMAGGLGKVGMAGRLAAVGERLTARLGRVGAAMAREAITGAISNAAQTAIQDETWRKGIGSGLGQVLGSGVKGAAVGAVSAGVSESLEGRLKNVMEGAMVDPARATRMQRLSRALGPAGSDVFREAISEGVGGLASSATDVLFDVASGRYHGTLGDALLHIGQSGLRDMLSAAGRSGMQARNRARYQDLLSRARAQPDANLSPSDLRALRRAAISAGAMHYGVEEADSEAARRRRAEGDTDADGAAEAMRREVNAGRRLLDGVPESLRRRLLGLSSETLQSMRGLLESPTLGTPQERLKLLGALHEAGVPMSAEAFLRELQGGQSALRQRAEEAAATRKQVQRALGQGLEGPARRYLQDVATEGLDQLGAAELQRVSEMIRGGQYDEKAAGELLAAARARSPDVPEEAFRRNLRQAVEAVAVGRQLERTARARQRADVLAAVSEEGRAAFADLPDESIRQVRRLLEAGGRGSDQLRESLYRAAAAETPGLDRGAFLKSLDAAVTHAAAERNEARRTRRAARAARLSDYPPRVRGQLSALPDDALVQLRVAQARGEQVSPQLRQSLHDAARRETPGVDLRRLDAAIDEAVRRPPAAASGPEGERLRRHLLAGVPEDQRRQLDGVPVLVMRPDEFIAFTRSASAQAATLIVEGRPVVVMREDADPRVLREEGLHALQAQEPRWRERIGTLDERRLAGWDRLPLEEQLQLYRGKVEVEIDAQRRLVASLEQELRGARGTNRDELALQLTRARSALENLGRRLAEVEALTPLQKRAVELGVVDRRNAVPYLDQAPRLFSKGPQNPPPRVILEPFAGPSLDSPLDLARKNPGAVVIATEATNRPPPEEVARLHAAGGAFVAENLSPGVPPSSVDEIKMRFPLPHDTAQQQAFAAQLRRLRTEFPDAPEHALLMRAMESGDFARQAESLTAYGPYALERLRPGGELEVVFWEKRIKDEAVAAQGHRFVDPADGRVYRLELVSVGTERRGDVAPHSGFGVPNVHDDMPVNVARFRKVEVPALEPVGPTGARGPASTREYDPDQAGGPVRRLDFSRIRFTGRGVDVVEAHVRRFGGGGDAELAMVARLRRIAAGEIPATDYDRAFYSHELRESVRYRRMGWPTGQPLDGDAAYELWNNLHTATLEDYRLREKLPDGDWALFHPEVMARQANGPTGARGPAPRVDWNAEVPLGMRSADAFDPDPSKGQCATWVWVMALRNAGWSGAVAVDPRGSMGSLIRNLRDPRTGDRLPRFTGTPAELVAQAARLPPGTQIVISARSQRGVMHQMLGVVQGDGSLEVMHSFSPDRTRGPGGGVDRVYHGEHAELQQFTGHSWWVLPRLPSPPAGMSRGASAEAPLSLDGPARRRMEGELRALGHDPEVIKLLSDQELFTAYSQAQARLTDQRIDEFRSTLPEAARAELDALRSTPGLAHRPVSETNLRDRVQNALQTPLVVDPTLGSGEVQVRYRKGLFGQVTGLEIRVGPGATLQDVLLHIPTLQAYKRYQGLAGAARRLMDAVRVKLAGGARIPAGSMAEEAWNEVRKLPAIIEARQRRLAGGDLDIHERVRLEMEIQQLEEQLARYARSLSDVGRGRGYVAARLDDPETLSTEHREMLDAALEDPSRSDRARELLDWLDPLVARQTQLAEEGQTLAKEGEALTAEKRRLANMDEASAEYRTAKEAYDKKRLALDEKLAANAKAMAKVRAEAAEEKKMEELRSLTSELLEDELGVEWWRLAPMLEVMLPSQLRALHGRLGSEGLNDLSDHEAGEAFIRLWALIGSDPSGQSALIQILQYQGANRKAFKDAQLKGLLSELAKMIETYPGEWSGTHLAEVHQAVMRGDIAGAVDLVKKRMAHLYVTVGEGVPRATAEKIIQEAKEGTFRGMKEYHGDDRHKFPQADMEEIIKNPDAVYFNGEVLIFRKGGDIVILRGPGQREGHIVTAYGPSGEMGKSGVAAWGDQYKETDKGLPITHDMIVNGGIPTGKTLDNGDKQYFRGAKQVFP